MAIAEIEVRPVAGCGALIEGIDPRRAGAAEIDRIRSAIFERGVVFLHGLKLTPEDQIAFARRLGPIVVNRYFPKAERYPEIAKVEKTEAQVSNIGGGWHTDHSYDQAPAMGSMLLAIETPPSGGDTLFENLYLAYESLSPGMRALLDRIVAVHSYAAGSDPDRGYGDPNADRDVARFPDVEHPLVRTHPESGRNALYLSGSWLLRFRDMTEEESRPLLDFLYAHAARPEFTCRFHWTPGALALLDNRCTQHFAINDYSGSRRVMHRVMFGGEPPLGVRVA